MERPIELAFPRLEGYGQEAKPRGIRHALRAGAVDESEKRLPSGERERRMIR